MNRSLRLRWRSFPLLAAAVSFCVAGCSSVEPESALEMTQAVRQEIQRRAGEEFREVALWKPAPIDGDPIMAELAPLLLEQTSGSNPPGRESDVPRTVWFTSNQVTIHERQHQQRFYFWRRLNTKASTIGFQGVRITLNAEGEPVIWEILSDASGAELIWVAQSIEIAAAGEFGAALPGRLCSVERPVNETPEVVVPNVVDDGPVPMGPILYVARRGDIHTVACRCSASRAEALSQQGYYQLQTISAVDAQRRIQGGTVPVVESWFDPERLQKRLRLPKEF